MISAKYISGVVTILSSIFFLPEVESIVKISLIVSVVIISILFNMFFFWNRLQEIFLKEAFTKFLVQLYKSEEFVEFLVEKRKKKIKHDIPA